MHVRDLALPGDAPDFPRRHHGQREKRKTAEANRRVTQHFRARKKLGDKRDQPIAQGNQNKSAGCRKEQAAPGNEAAAGNAAALRQFDRAFGRIDGRRRLRGLGLDEILDRLERERFGWQLRRARFADAKRLRL